MRKQLEQILGYPVEVEAEGIYIIKESNNYSIVFDSNFYQLEVWKGEILLLDINVKSDNELSELLKIINID